MAEAHAMIGAGEDLLWPGQRPRPKVAILAPRSSQPWDAAHIPIPLQIRDATNNHLNRSTVDYMAETFDLYLALQHANIPVDFIEEDDLTRAGLEPYRVLYVTEANVPEEGQRELGAWVKRGGSLVTVTGAACGDRYNEPCSVLAEATGVREEPRKRMLVSNAAALKPAGQIGDVQAFGPRGRLKGKQEGVEAAFDDGTPAIVRRKVGSGRILHFAWLPGISYFRSSNARKDGLPVGFSPVLRRWIVEPVDAAGVRLPVTADQPMVETPILLSPAGAAVTVLNWTGEKIERLKLTLRVPFRVKSIESVKLGRLPLEQTPDGTTCTIALGAADILLIRP